MKAQVFVGVDVSKRYLDVAFPEGIERVSNEPEGVSALAERLRESRRLWWCWRRPAATRRALFLPCNA